MSLFTCPEMERRSTLAIELAHLPKLERLRRLLANPVEFRRARNISFTCFGRYGLASWWAPALNLERTIKWAVNRGLLRWGELGAKS